jgi:hypothetical protein
VVKDAKEAEFASEMARDTRNLLESRCALIEEDPVEELLMRAARSAQLLPIPDAIASGIRNHKMGMQLRVESAAGIMSECRRTDIARHFGLPLEGSILLTRGEALKLYECDTRGLFVSGPESFVSPKHREDGDRLLC